MLDEVAKVDFICVLEKKPGVELLFPGRWWALAWESDRPLNSEPKLVGPASGKGCLSVVVGSLLLALSLWMIGSSGVADRFGLFSTLLLSSRLVEGEGTDSGRNEVVWNGRDDKGRRMASGTYFYRLEAGAYSATKRMVLVK